MLIKPIKGKQSNPNLTPYENLVSGVMPDLAGQSLAAPSINQNSIIAPSQTNLGDAFNQVKSTGLLPTFKPVEGLNASAFGDLKGFDDAYYQNLNDQASKRLQQQYFTGSNNLSDQLKNQMNKRGLIGSGIEAGNTQSLYQDFGSKMADMSASLSTQRAQNDIEMSKFNRGNALDIAKGNIDVNFRNQDNQNMLAELGLKSAGDQARTTNEFNRYLFQSEVDQKKNDQANKNEFFNQLNSAFSNKDRDPVVRDYLDSQIRSFIGADTGNTYSDYLENIESKKSDFNSPAAKADRASQQQEISSLGQGDFQGQLKTTSSGSRYQWNSLPRGGGRWVAL
jgi:hypothetical protein